MRSAGALRYKGTNKNLRLQEWNIFNVMFHSHSLRWVYVYSDIGGFFKYSQRSVIKLQTELYHGTRHLPKVHYNKTHLSHSGLALYNCGTMFNFIFKKMQNRIIYFSSTCQRVLWFVPWWFSKRTFHFITNDCRWSCFQAHWGHQHVHIMKYIWVYNIRNVLSSNQSSQHTPASVMVIVNIET